MHSTRMQARQTSRHAFQGVVSLNRLDTENSMDLKNHPSRDGTEDSKPRLPVCPLTVRVTAIHHLHLRLDRLRAQQRDAGHWRPDN